MATSGTTSIAQME